MQDSSYQHGQQAQTSQPAEVLDRTSYSAPTEALTPKHFRTATLDAAHEALVTILNRLFYLDQLIEVAKEYGYPLDNILSQHELIASSDTLMEIAERIQQSRTIEAQDLVLQRGK